MSGPGAGQVLGRPRRDGTLLLVLGMGRSGTSALTRVLGLCGAGMPRTPLPAVAGSNERGFWEPAPVVRAHDRILEQLGTSWDGPMPAGDSENGAWVGELAGLVREQFGDAPVMAVKDPRASRLVPLWERVADALGRRLVCVIAVRHPDEVAASLAARDGFPREKSLRLWREYTLDAERSTRSLPRVVVSYDALLSDWRGQLARIEGALGLGLDIAGGAAGISAFLDGRLRHHHASEGAGLDRTTGSVLEAMLELAADGKPDGAALDRAYREVTRESAAVRERTLRRVSPAEEMGFTGERFVPGIVGEIETEHVSRYVFASGLCAGKRVLDIACGEGYGSAMLAQVASDVVGVDIDEATVGHAERTYGREGLRFAVGSCEKIPAKKDSFDVVVSFETIEHIEDHAQFMREVRRVLRPGGVFVCSTPDKSVYLSGQERNPFHKKELTAEEFVALLGKRFTNTAFYAQRLVSGSLIARQARGRTELVRTRDGRSYERGPAGEGATYLLAVCSDGRVSWPGDQVLTDGRFTIGRTVHLSETCARLETEMASLDGRARQAESRAEDASGRAERLRSECERLRATATQTAAEREKLAEDRGRLLAERAAAETERDAAIRDAASAQVDYQRASAELDRVREELMGAREKAAAAQASLAATRNEIATLRRTTAEALAGRDAALDAQKAAEIHAARVEERTRQGAAAAAEARARDAGTIESLRQEADTANASLRGASAESEKLRDELAWIRSTRSWRWTRTMRFASAAGRAAAVRGMGLAVRATRTLGLPGTDGLVVARRAALFRGSRLFDAGYYLRTNPDVAATGVDPAWHFAARGGIEGRRPSAGFDPAWYVETNPDVAAAGVHPFEHFITRGLMEGRTGVPAGDLALPASGKDIAQADSVRATDRTSDDRPAEIRVNEQGAVPAVAVDPRRLANTKVLAFYLPQFHPIPENDAWWGKGFTEWTNVTRGRPMFPGHAQPVLPGELGFYDLRLPEVRERQAELARGAGIHGFCYHHYWFNGRRVLERPLEDVLVSGTPDLPFCVCWANENWTRRWDGLEQEILLRQQHTLASDRRFILDLMPYLEDERYVRVDGKPVVLVYRADLMVDAADTAAVWRDECRRAGVGDVHLCAVQFRTTDPGPLGFDAAVEFPPHHFPAPEITGRMTGMDPRFGGTVFDYPAGVREMLERPRKADYRLYRGVMPSWDNTARRMEQAIIHKGATPDLYAAWLASAINQAQPDDGIRDNLVFVNAWNEWAEGTVLEPRKDLGDAYLRATARVLGGSMAGSTGGDGDGRAPEITTDAEDAVPDISAGQAGPAPVGPSVEDRIKRMVRTTPALNAFLNRHPAIKNRAAGLVRRAAPEADRSAETPLPASASRVRWRGRGGAATPAGERGPRLLVVSHDAALAGAQLIVLENLRHWAGAGVDCRVLLIGSGELEPAFASVCPVACCADMPGVPCARAVRAVLEDLERSGWRPDAAFCNTVASSEAAEALHRAGVPVLSAVYELPTSIDDALGGRKTIERVMRSSRRVMVASAFVRDRLCDAYGIAPERLEPVHTGVLGRPAGDRGPARQRIRAELGVAEDTVVVLGCGSVHHRKGTDLFVGAAARAAAELAGDDARRVVFAWVGDDQSGPTFRNWCRHDIERAGLQEMVRLVGKRADPSEWFAGADVFALTSREDPFPMVNLEAMRAGLAVVAFADAGGATEVLTRDRGVVVPYADAAAMGTAVAALVRDPEARDRFGRRASAFAADGLAWDGYMARIGRLLASCSDRFGSAAGVAVPEHAGS